MFAVLVLISTTCFAQSVVKEGKTFKVVNTKSASKATKTEFTWKDSKDNIYPIFMSKSGACYIIKISKKTDKEYKQYLSKEISSQIAKEYGIEYKPKK